MYFVYKRRPLIFLWWYIRYYPYSARFKLQFHIFIFLESLPCNFMFIPIMFLHSTSSSKFWKSERRWQQIRFTLPIIFKQNLAFQVYTLKFNQRWKKKLFYKILSYFYSMHNIVTESIDKTPDWYDCMRTKKQSHLIHWTKSDWFHLKRNEKQKQNLNRESLLVVIDKMFHVYLISSRTPKLVHAQLCNSLRVYFYLKLIGSFPYLLSTYLFMYFIFFFIS